MRDENERRSRQQRDRRKVLFGVVGELRAKQARVNDKRAVDNSDRLAVRRSGCVPTMLAPPPRLSTMKGWPMARSNSGAISRAMMSEAPPAAYGTMTFTGRCG
jgi:hypothetical protein